MRGSRRPANPAKAPSTWRRRPRGKPAAEYVVWSDGDRGSRTLLLSTWQKDWHTEEAPLIPIIFKEGSDPLAESIGQRCPRCLITRNDLFDRPIDVTILNRTYGGDKLTAAKLRNARVTGALDHVASVVRVETLDLLAPFLDGHWLIGDVYLETGERLGGFRSAIDRRRLHMRNKYTKEWFKYFGSARFRECPRCAAFDHHLTMGGAYFLASEIPGPGIRLSGGSLELERSIAERLRLSDKREWPGGWSYRVPVFEERLDPIPTPYPVMWEDLVRGVAKNDDFPFDELGRWASRLRRDVERFKAEDDPSAPPGR